MSVEQRIKISCDDFDCDNVLVSGTGLTNTRSMASNAGWVNTVHFIGSERKPVLQDFCPKHREKAFDWATWENEGGAKLKENDFAKKSSVL